jgi:hypothetical protein
VDAEAFFFLHDVISSYVKEKERVLSTQGTAGSSGGAAQAGHPNPGSFYPRILIKRNSSVRWFFSPLHRIQDIE